MLCILIHTGDQEHVTEHVNVTAIIKVKDSPGKLWKAIHKIGVSIMNVEKLYYILAIHAWCTIAIISCKHSQHIIIYYDFLLQVYLRLTRARCPALLR
jgi:hypothetical protein